MAEVIRRSATEDAALAERERRGGWVVDGGYAALVPCASGKGWIGGERFNGSLGGGGFHDEFSFQVFATKNTKLTKVDCERVSRRHSRQGWRRFWSREGRSWCGGGEGGGEPHC